MVDENVNYSKAREARQQINKEKRNNTDNLKNISKQ